MLTTHDRAIKAIKADHFRKRDSDQEKYKQLLLKWRGSHRLAVMSE